MYLLIPKLILFASFYLFGVSSIRFPTQRRIACPSDNDLCIEITSCPVALTGFRAGKQPKICGWTKEVPRVCCPQDNKRIDDPPDVQNKGRKISSISPKGCGTRKLEPDPIVFSSSINITDPSIGIEPRNAADNDSSLPPTDLSEIFPIQFAVGGTPVSQKWPWMLSTFHHSLSRL
ncbi:uncharacterized protein NPIL_238701 [Nephila pilipes]|uniref:Spider venom protein n=1 Tax=Nephila pilipes TaxID=299642 RepID=A0A8X6NW62_NEPPI|nr:uncharacterized protein NPIL_238701 [Nephila pilipes]